MGYETIGFLALFASIVFLIYMLVPKKFRYLVLLIASYGLFITISKWLVIFLILTTVSIYFVGIGMDKYNKRYEVEKEGLEKEEKKALKAKYNKKKKLLMILGVLFNVILLVVLKYLNLFGEIFNGFFDLCHIDYNIPTLIVLIPLGLSYYTLNAIGYVIDVYRGKYSADRNFLHVALFMSYLPQMFEGPFAKYDELTPQLVEGNDFDYLNMVHGIQLFLFGILKKIVIADRINIITQEVFTNYSNYSGIVIIGAAILYTIQLYAEFSGIIEMVLGVSEMFGFKLQKNFDKPFMSRTVSEFWRRWHMSFGAWLKEYIFYSVSFSKPMTKMSKGLRNKNKNFLSVFIPSTIALFCVWTVCGLWHGCGVKYFVYGMYYFIIMVIGLLLEGLMNKFKNYENLKNNKAYICFQITRTFILVTIGMLIFRATTLNDSANMISRFFSGGVTNLISAGVIEVSEFIVMLISIAFLVFVDFMHIKYENIREEFVDKRHVVLRWTLYLLLILVIFYFGTFGQNYAPVDPVYGNF